MGEPKKTTARRPRATTRTKKLELPAAEVAIAPTPVPASAPVEAPAPTIAEAPAAPPPSAPFGEWVPIIYDGPTVFADADAGVFVTGTRTRLKARVAARLLRVEGFRLAA